MPSLYPLHIEPDGWDGATEARELARCIHVHLLPISWWGLEGIRNDGGLKGGSRLLDRELASLRTDIQVSWG